ncbi:MAG TPA: serine/threonine-protein kinase [Thermoanaerobaculia bacterium]|nr:serine/threonine-protein kinase [Thermoanaerobaculia bacterium]
MGDLATETRRQFGEYEVESVLGKGAMGMVYLARDRRIGRRVALKTVQVQQQFDDESEANEFYQRLQREAEVCGAMQHPNIVTLYEPGYENNVISFLATEWVEGESLRDRLKRSKPLPLDDALRIGEDILRGLTYAHAKGVIHRDIKPANILLSSDGQAKIADFGIARPAGSTLTQVGSMLGTPNYMSPEQVRCTDVTARSDLFSVGVVLYEMLTGVKPFSAPDVSSILRNVVEKDPPLASEVNPEVPEIVAKFVAKLLPKSPDARFASAGAALREMQALRGSTPTPTPAPIELVPIEVAVGNETTDTKFADRTPALGSQTQNVLPPALSYSIIGMLAAGLIGAIAVIHTQSDPTPRGVMTAQQRTSYMTKKNALAYAHRLLVDGKYDESVQAYEDYLKIYPNSITGQQGRDEAMKEAEAHRPNDTIVAEAPKRTTKKPQPQQRPSFLQRLFHHGSTKKNK